MGAICDGEDWAGTDVPGLIFQGPSRNNFSLRLSRVNSSAKVLIDLVGNNATGVDRSSNLKNRKTTAVCLLENTGAKRNS